jgi:pimeloyl-ACP methyl ester carboxylesterase
VKYFVTRGEDRRLDTSSRNGLRGSFIELSDGVTHYELTGPDEGDTVVLVGGLTVPLFYWDSLTSQLHTQGLRTLTYSGYGRGYSDRVRADYDETMFLRQLTELTVALGLIRPHHVVGTSMGALVAMTYASQHPTSISTLTLVGPAGLLRPRTSQALLLGTDRLARFIGKRFGRRWLEDHLGHEIRDPGRAVELGAMVRDAYRYEGSLYALFSTLRRYPLFGRAELFRHTGALGVPTMLIWGDDDHVTPIDRLDEARELLDAQQCHVIEQCGHMAPFERPHDVADLIAAFTTSRVERLDS